MKGQKSEKTTYRLNNFGLCLHRTVTGQDLPPAEATCVVRTFHVPQICLISFLGRMPLQSQQDLQELCRTCAVIRS